MKLSNIAALYAMRLRAQLGQELLALIGIAAGVALLFAALVANTSLTGTFERLTRTVVGDARLQVTARGQAIDQGLLTRIERLPDVRAAAAFLEVHAEARGPIRRRSVLLIGADPGLAELGGALTRSFSYGFLSDVRAVALPTPLADDLGLALGQTAELVVRGQVVRIPMGAKLQDADVGALINSPFVVGQLRFVQELSGLPHAVSRIMVVPQAGRDDEVRSSLVELTGGRASITRADHEAVLFRQAATPTNQSTLLFSLFSALVGFLFAHSAVLLTVPQRRRLIADLQAEGYGPPTLLKVLLFDALALGVIGSLVGLLLGLVVARRLFDEAPGFLGYAFAFEAEQIVTIGSVVLAGLGGIVASCVAVLAPTATMLVNLGRDSAGLLTRGPAPSVAWKRMPIGAGAACCAVGLAVVIASPSTTTVGFGALALLTIGMLLLLPSFVHTLVRGLDAATAGITSIVPFIAIADLRDAKTRARSIAVAATGAVAVFATVALQGARADLQRGLDRTSHDLAANAPLWVVAPGPANLLATTPFPRPSLVLASRRLELEPYRGSFLDVGDRRVWVLGPPAASPLPLPRGDITGPGMQVATRRLRTGGWVIMSSAVAHEQRVRVGQSVRLPTPVPLTLRVAALSSNLGWPPGAIVMNANDYARAWGRGDVSALLATPASGVSLPEAKAELRDALSGHPGLVVQSSSEREREQRAASRSGLGRLSQIATLVLISAMIAMAAAMAGMIWQRRGFLAAMKVEGYSTAELWRSLLLEAAVLMGAGCVVGAAFGLIGQSLLSRALMVVTGFPVEYSPALFGALLSCVAVTTVAVGIIAAFGHRAARIPAEAALR